ncbi:hypothetical protein Lsan_0362 [Legionella santicrucis]|uniref:Uncharacterized protein n=1 Tax=Legionella santicrucis TaxID=45074 RepID=A0A0W0ZE68_9GAMM|nr:hypothetical protein [Legionella santicrucis]KTD67471.1 hypothetical protein Lsan_0362 [Legionella santicrucis]
MPKSEDTTPAYNALFQEHSSPSVGLDSDKEPFLTVDTGQSCHVFATASAPSWEKRKSVNEIYENIGTARAFERLERQDQHEFSEKRKKERNPQYVIKPFPEPSIEERTQERKNNMEEILQLRNLQETVLPVENMYLCGGFREGKMTPEHMWIEDHTNNRTYDTFINRGGIAVVKGVGKDGEAFEPGCEGSPFEGDEIGRVKVAGYTYGQLIAIASGAEKKPPFPDSIANTPQVLMAMETVKLVNEALAKVPEPVFTEAEQRILDKVQEEQIKKDSDTEIKKVVTDLTGADKVNYESALNKLAEVARQQREVATAIVGTTFNPIVKLSQDLSAIKPDPITNSDSLDEAVRLKTGLLEEVRKLEAKKGTISVDYQEKFQQKIDEARNKIELALPENLEKLGRELNSIKPEQIKQSKTLKEANSRFETLTNKIQELEEKKNTLPEKYQAKYQEKIDTLKQSVGNALQEKVQVQERVEQIRRAAENYLEWSTHNAKGFRFSFLSHGSYGREQAQKLITMIENKDTPIANILKVANQTVSSSGTNKFSFSRFLHDELKGKKELVGKDSLTQKFKNYKEEMKSQLHKEMEKEESNTKGMQI